MMEVKQNTAVDLNELLTSAKHTGPDEVDDTVMTDLSDSTHDLVNRDLIKANVETTSIEELENGNGNAMTLLIKDVDVEVDLNNTVNSEFEDALLAEDDVLPKIETTKVVESTASVTEDILADKAETSNSTTSSSNARDPGDDLDTLLSKINDIVEDCIEKENDNTISNVIHPNETTNNVEEETKQEETKQEETKQEETKHEETKPEETKQEETEQVNSLNNSVMIVEKENVAENTNLIEKQKSENLSNNIDNKQELNEDIENETNNKEISISLEIPVDKQEILENIQQLNEEEEESSIDEKKESCTEVEAKDDKISTQFNNVDKISENIQEMTEEAKAVQDNEITSNSIEKVDAGETSQPATNNENEPKPLDNVEINKSLEKSDESIATTEIATITPTNDKTSIEDVKPTESVENEDSDDEIVFYVDKPPEVEKSEELETTALDMDKETSKEENSLLKKEIESSERKTAEDDDDVVLLEDDEEEENNKEIFTKNKDDHNEIEESKASAVADDKDDVKDNSDNARDDFVAENTNEKPMNKTDDTEAPDETNSNCSSSSNLLQEAKSVKNSVDEGNPEEAENEEEEDDGDVELIESELKDSETLEKVDDSEVAPPAKRIRLSEDGEQPSKTELPNSVSNDGDVENEKQESLENAETSSVVTNSSLKRTHDVIELEEDDKSNDSKVSIDGSNKKPKTDSFKRDAENVEEIKDCKTSDVLKSMEDDKKYIKAVPSYEPIPLYPAPKFEVLKSEPTINLDYLRKFRKSFDNLTKQDLEELVLQKVVEAIIHRSEFSEMRELIEKQEKLITAHRTKISELSKQFRDLEMVHNRVVKDIEQRNSQFIMPVKITRAVGLQVYIPNKKSLTENAPPSTGTNVPSSPQRPVSSQASSTSSTPPQRQFLTSQTDTQQRPTSTVSSGSGNTGNVRRGCVQKITPIRPVPGANQPTSTGVTALASAAYRTTPNHSASTQPRILNKNAAPAANPTAIQRSRFLGSNQDARMPTQQQISRTPNMPANSQRVAANAPAQPKPTSNVATTGQRRSEPLTPQAANSSTSAIVDNYINTLTHLTGGNTAVSITPAKPKEKAVIDLTDEDEAPGQTAGSQAGTQTPVNQVQRRSLPAQNSANSQVQYGRAAPSLARIPPANQMANNKNRQMSSMQAQKNSSFSSINTPPGTSITRINLPSNTTNVQRVKYSHPAPLPATPPQAFNPAWKLPPPRPTIRISNLDNGIVISWTMEESMDRHAECVSYQIYAYQETSGPPMVDSWRHVGDVKAMLLPMAVTLTQFQEGQRYYFAVRAVDCHQRFGPFSLPKTWS